MQIPRRIIPTVSRRPQVQAFSTDLPMNMARHELAAAAQASAAKCSCVAGGYMENIPVGKHRSKKGASFLFFSSNYRHDRDIQCHTHPDTVPINSIKKEDQGHQTARGRLKKLTFQSLFWFRTELEAVLNSCLLAIR